MCSNQDGNVLLLQKTPFTPLLQMLNNECALGLCHSLAVGEVDLLEDGVEVRGRLAVVVLVEEDGRASELQAQLLHSLAVIHRQQKTLSAAPRSNRHQHREVLRERRV